MGFQIRIPWPSNPEEDKPLRSEAAYPQDSIAPQKRLVYCLSPGLSPSLNGHDLTYWDKGMSTPIEIP